MNQRRQVIGFLLVLILLGGTLDVCAFGAAGCGNRLHSPLGKALTTGTTEELETAIQKWLDYKEKIKNVPQNDKMQWRAHEVKNLIEGQHEKDAVCELGPLLSVAAQAGNLDVVRYLLDTPMGIKPSIPADILFSCGDGTYDVNMTHEQQIRRREAFALILDTNALDVNSRRNGLTPIQACVAPELLSLFLERGANPNVVFNSAAYSNVSLLDKAVDDAVGYKEGSWTARRLRGFDRAKLFASVGMDSIVGHSIETKVRYLCNLVINEERWNDNTCRELSKFIKASAGTFGNN